MAYADGRVHEPRKREFKRWTQGFFEGSEIGETHVLEVDVEQLVHPDRCRQRDCDARRPGECTKLRRHWCTTDAHDHHAKTDTQREPFAFCTAAHCVSASRAYGGVPWRRPTELNETGSNPTQIQHCFKHGLPGGLQVFSPHPSPKDSSWRRAPSRSSAVRRRRHRRHRRRPDRHHLRLGPGWRHHPSVPGARFSLGGMTRAQSCNRVRSRWSRSHR